MNFILGLLLIAWATLIHFHVSIAWDWILLISGCALIVRWLFGALDD